MARKQVLICDEVLLTDSTAAAQLGWVRCADIQPPFDLTVRTDPTGGTDPTTISVAILMVVGAGPDVNDVSQITGTIMTTSALTAATAVARDASPEDFQLPLWVKALHNSTYGVNNDGLRVRAWLTGNAA